MTQDVDWRSICFLCGDNLAGEETNKEHIFPKWVLERFEKHGKYDSFRTGLKRQRQGFYRHTLTVHKRCNMAFDEHLEKPISKGEYDNDRLWLWCLKIIVGLRFYREGHRLLRADPNSEKDNRVEMFEDDLDSFWGLGPQLLMNGEFENTAKFSVIELDYLFDTSEFYYLIHEELGVMWLALDNRSFLVFFRSLFGPEKQNDLEDFWRQLQATWAASGEVIAPQFRYNIFSAMASTEVYFCSAERSFDFESGRWITLRPPNSIELEDTFYKWFDLTPEREEGTGRVLRFHVGEGGK